MSDGEVKRRQNNDGIIGEKEGKHTNIAFSVTNETRCSAGLKYEN